MKRSGYAKMHNSARVGIYPTGLAAPRHPADDEMACKVVFSLVLSKPYRKLRRHVVSNFRYCDREPITANAMSETIPAMQNHDAGTCPFSEPQSHGHTCY